MKRKSLYSVMAASLFLLLSLTETVLADDYFSYYHVQTMLGRMTIDEGDYLLAGSSEGDDSYLLEGDKLDYPILGVSVQKNLWGEKLKTAILVLMCSPVYNQEAQEKPSHHIYMN